MITRKLDCILTEDDVLDRGRQLANAEQDLSNVEYEKKAAMDEFKKSIDAVNGRINTLAKAIREAKEERDVPCVIEDDWQSYEKTVRRTDTGEIIERYEMSETDKQRSLIV